MHIAAVMKPVRRVMPCFPRLFPATVAIISMESGRAGDSLPPPTYIVRSVYMILYGGLLRD